MIRVTAQTPAEAAALVAAFADGRFTDMLGGRFAVAVYLGDEHKAGLVEDPDDLGAACGRHTARAVTARMARDDPGS